MGGKPVGYLQSVTLERDLNLGYHDRVQLNPKTQAETLKMALKTGGSEVDTCKQQHTQCTWG